MEDKSKKEAEVKKELSLDELVKVTGGAGMRKVKKEQTYDISDDIKERI